MKVILKRMLSLFILLFAQPHAFGKPHCSQLFILNQPQSQYVDIRDLQTFGQAMSEGMLLRSDQGELFEIYQKFFLGDPKKYLGPHNFKSLVDLLQEYPELQKPHFREFEIVHADRIYRPSENLNRFIRSQISTAGQIRSNLLQIEANSGFWRKLLDYQGDSREVLLQRGRFDLVQSKRGSTSFRRYLRRILLKTNPDLLKDLKDERHDYQTKVKILFTGMHKIHDWMQKRGRDTTAIRQAMVDLMSTVGFGNPKIVSLLKSPNALDKIEGLKKLVDERDTVSIELGYLGYFAELQSEMKIDFPTGFSRNENLSEVIDKLEHEVSLSSYTLQPSERLRVRSLSLQESPFRSCLGGADCSSETYFSKALDPNFYYFTMTDTAHHSNGQATVVLGTAKNPETGMVEPVAFLDKIQNVSNQRIPIFLAAIARSVATRGYLLGIPSMVGDHNGISNKEGTRVFLGSKIIPKLDQEYYSFEPHQNFYPFQNMYSTAYDRMNVRIFKEVQMGEEFRIYPGQYYTSFYSKSQLSKEDLLLEIQILRDSRLPNDLLRYISASEFFLQLHRLNLFSIEHFYSDLIRIARDTTLDFSVRKRAIIESLLLKNEIIVPLELLDLKLLTEGQRTQLAGEINQWTSSNEPRKKAFIDGIIKQWDTALVKGENQVLELLYLLRLYDINLRNESGYSSLVVAAHYQQESVIRWLLEQPELDPQIKNQEGYSDLEVLQLLGYHSLASFIKSLRPDFTSRLINSGISLSQHDPVVGFVEISPGLFRMGEQNSKVQVTLTKPFAIMSIPTTQKLWSDFLEIYQSTFKNQTLSGVMAQIYKLPLSPSRFKGQNHPVEQVSYFEVSLWLNGINILSEMKNVTIQSHLERLFPGHRFGDRYRLPTEAEWEFVARLRGLANGDYAFVGGAKSIDDYAWHSANSRNQTQPVGLKRPIYLNGKPIYDLHGNVWEWVVDRYDILTGGLNPQGSVQMGNDNFRVYRGGGWDSDPSVGLRIPKRSFGPLTEKNRFVGFRIVRDLK